MREKDRGREKGGSARETDERLRRDRARGKGTYGRNKRSKVEEWR